MEWCVPPQIHYVDILTPNGMVLRGGLWEVVRSEPSWMGLNETSALFKETPESSLAPSAHIGQLEDSLLWTKKQASSDTTSAKALTLDFTAY